MADARSSEHSANEGDLRGAAAAAPRATDPLKLVEAAVAAGARSSAAAELLAELRDTGWAAEGPEQETLRLLAGVLLHDPDELRLLRERTIAPLEAYDQANDTDLVATLERFLTRDGSTSDTAEAMRLHRHTVGYRLARIHEVCGLSPYESEGRERLSLGLKARRLLLAAERRSGSD